MSAAKHTPRSILESFYAAERVYMAAPPEQRDFAPMAATLSPDLLLEQTPALPYGGTFHGPEGMQAWARQMADLFDTVDVQGPEFFEREGSESIVILGKLHLRVRKTGEVLDSPFAQVVTVDLEAGVIKSIRPLYWDVHGLNKAVGYHP
ncbi:MAG: hypothetical protein STHCBS139747_004743 [Sporothrix thermara]